MPGLSGVLLRLETLLVSGLVGCFLETTSLLDLDGAFAVVLFWAAVEPAAGAGAGGTAPPSVAPGRGRAGTVAGLLEALGATRFLFGS